MRRRCAWSRSSVGRARGPVELVACPELAGLSVLAPARTRVRAGARTLKPASSGHATSSTGPLALPTELLDQAQRRLMVASAVLAVVIAAVVAGDFALGYALGRAEPPCG